jgi:3-dehydroquinate synthase II
VGGLARALELGVDALCVDAEAPVGLWEAVFKARAERGDSKCSTASAQSNAGPVIVTGSYWRRQTSNTILADRICVDLVQTLSTDEGCWVGSSAKIMALILSEAASSQFVPTRPFLRVNAGPVHSYILMSDLTTKYLCEMEPSDQVLVHNAFTGKSRALAVGRLKQEVRPCVLVELDDGKRKACTSILAASRKGSARSRRR